MNREHDAKLWTWLIHRWWRLAIVFGHVGQCKRRCTINLEGPCGAPCVGTPVCGWHPQTELSGQKLNMIMCARFNLPTSHTPSAILPHSLHLVVLLFLIILFFYIDFRKRQSNSQATYATSCCGPPAALKMKRFSLKIMLPYASVCVCVCVRACAVYLVKTTLWAQNWKPKS